MTTPIQLDSPQDIPLFPLRVVMFPGSRLDLQIFEQRYLDMISRCMRSGDRVWHLSAARGRRGRQ
ncbi:MAG: LON peptidase substrate-binding domain-containing protein [Pseudohongiellaceae bacterium]